MKDIIKNICIFPLWYSQVKAGGWIPAKIMPE
jgi:hypothetical protein